MNFLAELFFPPFPLASVSVLARLICWVYGHKQSNLHIFDVGISQRLYNERHYSYQTAYILQLFALSEDKHVTNAGPTQVLHSARGEKEARPSPW
jgi:hypothetical protein